MENLTNKIEVLTNLFDLCEELKSNTYSVTFWKDEINVQAHYSNAIIQTLNSEHGFEFNVRHTGFIQSKKRFYDFKIDITLT